MTNTVKHTPGPWNVKEHQSWNGCGELVTVESEGGLRIAISSPTKFEDNDQSWSELELANAALIAAAPELLEALKLAVEHYVGTGRTSKTVVGEAGIAADKIHAAIAKAETQC